MKITEIRCAVIDSSPVVRILTDEGVDGLGQIERAKPFLKPNVLWLGQKILGRDPRLVEQVMQEIRQFGGSKPWGGAVSAIEMALWDIAGKAAGVPVHRLLGGKVRDRVRVYTTHGTYSIEGQEPEHYAANVRFAMERPEGFTIVKRAISFHSPMRDRPGFYFGDPTGRGIHGFVDRGVVTPKGFAHLLDCIAAMKEVTGDEVGLALDCGPGWNVPDAIKFARAVERHNLMWLEDLLAGDYTASAGAGVYREVQRMTSSYIHCGEQLFGRQNFKELIESRAVSVVGPDPCDVGGIAEFKWIAEFAELYGVLVAPHGTGNGLIGLGALVQMAATLPQNYIAFEYPDGEAPFWSEILEGWPERRVVDGHIVVPDRPGMGVAFRADAARKHLAPEDAGFLD